VKKFRLQLIGVGRAIRQEQILKSVGGRELWDAVSSFAARSGRDGEHIQVFDDEGDMIISVGVATARGSSNAPSVAA
jgi:hypothetical protein